MVTGLSQLASQVGKAWKGLLRAPQLIDHKGV